MTDEELAAIKARVEAATPGPWISGLQTVYKDRERSLPEGWLAVYQIATVENTPWLVGIDSTGGWLSALISSKTRSDDAFFIAHARQDIPALLAEVERLQTECEGLRKIIPEICLHCGGRMDVDPGHIERCYCLPVIRTLHAENEQLRILSVNLAYQCRIVLDQWPEFELDMSLPAGHQLWRRATEKYLAQLSEKPA